MTDIEQLTQAVQQFIEERDWKQFHNAKDSAMSLILEAAEVLEHFKGEKLRISKFKAKSKYRRVTGHRQYLTKVKILDILMPLR